MILDAVASDPGIHKTNLCRRVGLGWGTLLHHLGVLEEQGRVRVERSGRQSHVFPAAWTRPQRRARAALRQGSGAPLAAALCDRPWSTVGDLASHVGRSRQAVRRHLAILADHGLVERRGDHRPQFRATPELLQMADAGSSPP